MNTAYRPGRHQVASLHVEDSTSLLRYEALQEFLAEIIDRFSLQRLGDVYHNFPGGGFTALICLSESHISFHSWPEQQLVNLDIYLSNHLRKNDGTVDAIFDAIVDFWKATILQQISITR